MSNYTATRNVPPSLFPIGDGTEVKTAVFLAEGCDGVDTRFPSFQLPRSFLSEARDIALTTNKRVTTGPGYSVETTIGDSVIDCFSLRSPTSNRLYFVTTAGIKTSTLDVIGFSSPVALTGPAFTGLSTGDSCGFLVWDENTLLVALPTNRLIAIDVPGATYAEVADSPMGATHIAYMNGRVVLSGFLTDRTRVQWSAQFDYTEWGDAALGAGYEDLGVSDTASLNPVFSVWPFSDTLGIVLRQYSVDIVTTSTNFDAPFFFAQRHKGVNLPFPKTAARTSTSVIVAGMTDVFELTPESVASIGLAAGWTDQAVPVTRFAAYNPEDYEYLLYGHDSTRLWVYSTRHRCWIGQRTEPAASLTAMAFIGGRGATPYGSLSGTYGSLTGTLDTLGVLENARRGMVFFVGATPYYSPVNTASTYYIRFPDIEPATPERNITLLSIEVGYRALTTDTQTLLITDSAGNTSLNTFTPTASTNMKRSVVKRTLTSQWLRVALSGSSDMLIAYVIVRYTEGQTGVNG